jgi:hypothetical protein
VRGVSLKRGDSWKDSGVLDEFFMRREAQKGNNFSFRDGVPNLSVVEFNDKILVRVDGRRVRDTVRR